MSKELCLCAKEADRSCNLSPLKNEKLITVYWHAACELSRVSLVLYNNLLSIKKIKWL